MNQRDNVSTKVKVSYSDISERNIFDTRFTGSGKTTSAIEYISEVVGENRPVIVLMQSYERLENNYHKELKEPAQARTITFKSKAQEGMCTHSSRYKQLWKERKTPKNECKKCPDFKKCDYQKQLDRLTEYSQSNDGFCVLTTEKNLNKILSETKDRNPVLIIDDISLSSVLMPELEIKLNDLESLGRHLEKQGSKATHLHALASLLYNFPKENENDIIKYISSNEPQLKRELLQFQTDHEGNEYLPSHPALSFVSRLIFAVKQPDYLHFYSEYRILKVVVDETSKFNSFRICYLNATPSLKDKNCIKQLGDFKPLPAKVDESKRYVIFQIVDSATTKQAIKTSTRMKSDVQELAKVIKSTLGVIEQKLLIFGHDDVLTEWVKEGVFSGLETEFETYFGSGTRGTNDYKNYPISFILGTPYYPPEYFLHPAFEPYWKSKKEIEKERKDNPGGFLSYVSRDISDHEAKINLLQMIGRNLRDSSDNPNAVKIVIVFTSIDISKECKEQNGGIVVETNIRKEIPVMQGKKKGKTPFFDKYKEISQKALNPQIKRSIKDYIDKLIEENPDVPIPLDDIATKLHERITIYETAGIKAIISKLYNTDSWHVEHNGKKVNTAFIKSKRNKNNCFQSRTPYKANFIEFSL